MNEERMYKKCLLETKLSSKAKHSKLFLPNRVVGWIDWMECLYFFKVFKILSVILDVMSVKCGLAGNTVV